MTNHPVTVGLLVWDLHSVFMLKTFLNSPILQNNSMSWLTNICYYENNHSHVCYDSLDLHCEQEGQCNMVTTSPFTECCWRSESPVSPWCPHLLSKVWTESCFSCLIESTRLIKCARDPGSEIRKQHSREHCRTIILLEWREQIQNADDRYNQTCQGEREGQRACLGEVRFSLRFQRRHEGSGQTRMPSCTKSAVPDGKLSLRSPRVSQRCPRPMSKAPDLKLLADAGCPGQHVRAGTSAGVCQMTPGSLSYSFPPALCLHGKQGNCILSSLLHPWTRQPPSSFQIWTAAISKSTFKDLQQNCVVWPSWTGTKPSKWR